MKLSEGGLLGRNGHGSKSDFFKSEVALRFLGKTFPKNDGSINAKCIRRNCVSDYLVQVTALSYFFAHLILQAKFSGQQKITLPGGDELASNPGSILAPDF